MKFYLCKMCGNLVGMVNESGVVMECCGQDMIELVPCTSDGAKEKHVPVYTCENNHIMVTIGAEEHPMTDKHYIEWIALETEKGAQRKDLKPGDAPRAEFVMTYDDKPVAVYAYCNIHGLWMVDVECK